MLFSACEIANGPNSPQAAMEGSLPSSNFWIFSSSVFPIRRKRLGILDAHGEIQSELELDANDNHVPRRGNATR